jgi:hypothetical protein
MFTLRLFFRHESNPRICDCSIAGFALCPERDCQPCGALLGKVLWKGPWESLDLTTGPIRCIPGRKSWIVSAKATFFVIENPKDWGLWPEARKGHDRESFLQSLRLMVFLSRPKPAKRSLPSTGTGEMGRLPTSFHSAACQFSQSIFWHSEDLTPSRRQVWPSIRSKTLWPFPGRFWRKLPGRNLPCMTVPTRFHQTDGNAAALPEIFDPRSGLPAYPEELFWDGVNRC